MRVNNHRVGGFLFVPYPAGGHVSPMLPVIRELIGRGFSVGAVADRRHAPMLRASGARVIELIVAPDVYVPARVAGMGSSRYLTSRVRRRMFLRSAFRNVLAEVSRGRAELVVLDPMMASVDQPLARLGVRTALFSTTYAMGTQVPSRWNPAGVAWGPRSDWLRRVSPAVRAFGRDRLVLVNAIPELQPAVRTVHGDVHYVGPLVGTRSGVDLSGYGLSRRRRLLLVSAGTVFTREPAYFRSVVQAFEATSWQVVVATGPVDPGSVGPVPPNVVIRRWVPQQALLERADVFLTHAGMNSALEALSCGVPMVVSPKALDQRYVARRLVELGVAVRAPVRWRGATQVRQLVERAYGDVAMRAVAAGWRDRLSALDNAATAADLLIERALRLRD